MSQMLKSDYYCDPDEPKKVKFLVFSNIKPVTNVSVKKRLIEDDKEDIDFVYLKEFMTKFPSVSGDEQYELFRNQDEEQFWDVLNDMKKDPKLEPYHLYIFIFLTFCSSKEGEISIDFFKACIPLEKIWEDVGQISAMKGKPKIFLVQADDVGLTPPSPMKTKGPQPFDYIMKIPTDADRLTIMSTIPGEGFVEGDTDPSFLIQAFVEAVSDNKDKMDLLSLTVVINEKIANRIRDSKVNKTRKYENQLKLPCVTSTFRKLLVI